MKKIAIYGAGGFGRETACILNALNAEKPIWDFIGFFDDGLPVGQTNQYGIILGGIAALNNYTENLAVVFSIANPVILREVIGKIKNSFIEFPNIFAPGTIFYDKDSLSIGKGNLFFFGARISCDVSIGDFNLANSAISLGHDVNLGNFNILGPMVRLSGNTFIGDENFFGVQSVALQGVKIGSKTTIGAGSIVMRNTVDGYLYFGNPAKKMMAK
jgi:sugar O-acyltransferase (sialic acid O-acetyltransferase NeuD family)